MLDIKYATQFDAENGNSIVYTSPIPYGGRGQLLLSTDRGQTFVEVACMQYHGSESTHEIEFIDITRSKVVGKLRRTHDVVTYKDVKYYRQKEATFRPGSVVPLPPTRTPKHLARMREGTYLYVSQDRYAYPHKDYKVFIGDGTSMREIVVDRAPEPEYGGPTIIYTPEGTLTYPSYIAIRRHNLRPVWDGQVLEHLRLDYYDIVEEDGEVTITPK